MNATRLVDADVLAEFKDLHHCSIKKSSDFIPKRFTELAKELLQGAELIELENGGRRLIAQDYTSGCEGKE